MLVPKLHARGGERREGGGGVIQKKNKMEKICLWLLTDTNLAIKTSKPTKKKDKKKMVIIIIIIIPRNNNAGVETEL